MSVINNQEWKFLIRDIASLSKIFFLPSDENLRVSDVAVERFKAHGEEIEPIKQRLIDSKSLAQKAALDRDLGFRVLSVVLHWIEVLNNCADPNHNPTLLENDLNFISEMTGMINEIVRSHKNSSKAAVQAS